MIAPAKPLSPIDQQQFLEMLPRIRWYARKAFRYEAPEQRQELIAEVIANAFVAFARLVESSKQDIAYATPLAKFAVRQVRAGRRVGSKNNVKDVGSEHCRRSKGVTVETLNRYNPVDEEWQDVLVEDRHAGPAEVAVTRLDFAAWPGTLAPRLRKIAKTLATGETTTKAAQRFGVSAARISRIRGELRDAWLDFQGELAELAGGDPASDSLPAINRSLASLGEAV